MRSRSTGLVSANLALITSEANGHSQLENETIALATHQREMSNTGLLPEVSATSRVPVTRTPGNLFATDELQVRLMKMNGEDALEMPERGDTLIQFASMFGPKNTDRLKEARIVGSKMGMVGRSRSLASPVVPEPPAVDVARMSQNRDRERGEFMERSTINRVVKRLAPPPRHRTHEELEEELGQCENEGEPMPTDTDVERAMQSEALRRETRGVKVAMTARMMRALGLSSIGMSSTVQTIGGQGNDTAQSAHDGAQSGSFFGALFGGAQNEAEGATLRAGMSVDAVVYALTERFYRSGPATLATALDDLALFAAQEARAAMHRRRDAPTLDVWRDPAVTAACVRVACAQDMRTDPDVARAVCQLIAASVDGVNADALSLKQRCVNAGGLMAVLTTLHFALRDSQVVLQQLPNQDEFAGATRSLLDAGGYAGFAAHAQISAALYREQLKESGDALSIAQEIPRLLLDGAGNLGKGVARGVGDLGQWMGDVVDGGRREERATIMSRTKNEHATIAACRAVLVLVQGFDEPALGRKELAIDMHVLETTLSLTIHTTRQPAADPQLSHLLVELGFTFWAHMQHHHAHHHESVSHADAYIWQASARRRRAERRMGLGVL